MEPNASEQPDPQPQSEDHTETPNDDNSGNETQPEAPEAASCFDAQAECKRLSDRIDQMQAMLDAVGVGGGEVVAPEVDDDASGVDPLTISPEDISFDEILNSKDNR